MVRQNGFAFHPERIPWIGAALLGASFLLGIPFLWTFPRPASLFTPLEGKRKEEKLAPLCPFSLGLARHSLSLQLPDFEQEMIFSFDPPRPGGTIPVQQLRIHLNQSGESKRVALPARIDLRFERARLSFASEKSPFWIEVDSSSHGQIEGRIFAEAGGEEKAAVGSFSAAAQESPVRSAEEFAEGSPFRLLAEARWWGHDLFREQYEGGVSLERLEIGPPSASRFLEAKQGDWLVWDRGNDQGGWNLLPVLEEGAGKPIARILSNGGKTLAVEGWDLEGHIRLNLFPASGPALKTRGEELFSAIRIRSEKQISCMLEKQCLILKPGDWVLKRDNRWRALRKKEERESFLKGDLVGDLFVFEQILQKQGQKVIQGRLFNPGRSQCVPIEIAAQSMRKLSKGKEDKRRGKGQ